ncbi:MAG: hypothetical protein ACTSO7_06130 [Candidatus Heimdallarchaeota archaeon]
MFNWSNYFSQDNSAVPIAVVWVYTILLAVMELVILVYFILTIIRLKRNLQTLKGVRSFIMTFFGLVFWSLGEIIERITYLISNGQKVLFFETDSIFLPMGLTFAFIFFSFYLKNILQTAKYSKSQKLLSHKFINLTTIVAFLGLLLYTGRFLAIGFMSEEMMEQTGLISDIATLVIALMLIIVSVISFYLMFREYKSITSKLNRARLVIFLTYLFSLVFTMIAIIIYLVYTVASGNLTVIFYLAIPIFIFSLPAAISLYYGMFIPRWLQIRMGVLPAIEE